MGDRRFTEYVTSGSEQRGRDVLGGVGGGGNSRGEEEKEEAGRTEQESDTNA